MVYNFVFAKSTPGRYGMDPRIRNTILSIISDFWDDYEEVILFVCDSSDGRSECRRISFSTAGRSYLHKKKAALPRILNY